MPRWRQSTDQHLPAAPPSPSHSSKNHWYQQHCWALTNVAAARAVHADLVTALAGQLVAAAPQTAAGPAVVLGGVSEARVAGHAGQGRAEVRGSVAKVAVGEHVALQRGPKAGQGSAVREDSGHVGQTGKQ